MKILRIVYDWPPPWDGLAPAPYEMTLTQNKLGHEIDVFCGRWPFAGPIEKLPNVKLYSFWREPFPGAIFFTTSLLMFFYYLYWRWNNKPDLVHSHGHFAIWIYLYRFILGKIFKSSKELKTPLVVHFHNNVKGRKVTLQEKDSKIKFYSEHFIWPLEEFASKLALKTADAHIFVSEDIKEEAIEYYNADPRKCFVVETGVSTDLFKPVGSEEKEKVRRDMGLDPDDKIVLNHGVMLERKNIHLLIEALQFLPPHYKLLLVGSGDKEYLKKLEDIMIEKKLTHRIVRVGYTPYPEVPIAFQASDVFVLPSSWEGLPKVVMQSLACGIPALVSGFKVSEEIRGLYYLSDLSPQNIAQEIQSAAEKPKDVDVTKVMQLYSWDTKAGKVEDIYAGLIQSIQK